MVSLKQFYDSELTAADVLEEERYQNFQLLNKGGSKRIYRVFDAHCSREVAYARIRDKVMSLEQSLEFIREVQVTASFEHPNIIRIYDMGIKEGLPWYTMELSSGKTLTDRLIEEDVMSLSTCLEVFLDLCDAVEYAHERDVLHLDLKPDNVAIGKNGQILLTDWGLAAGVHHKPSGDLINAQTHHGKMKGSLGYMAPDQTDLKLSNTVSADIFSLGAILYFLLTGEAPIPGDSKEESVRNTQDGRLKPIERPEIPARLTPLLKKALMRNPKERYQSVSDLKKEIYMFNDGFSTIAEPPSIRREMALFYKRNTPFCLTVLAALLCLAILNQFYISALRKSEQSALHAKAEALAQKQSAQETLDKYLSAQKEITETNQEYSSTLFYDAMDSLSNFDFPNALKEAENSVKRNPEDPRANHRLGVIYIIHQQFDRAIPHLEKSTSHRKGVDLMIAQDFAKKEHPLSLEDKIALLDLAKESEPLRLFLYRYYCSQADKDHITLLSYLLTDINQLDEPVSITHHTKNKVLNLSGNTDLKTLMYPKSSRTRPTNLLEPLKLNRLIIDDTPYNRKNAGKFIPHAACKVVFQ